MAERPIPSPSPRLPTVSEHPSGVLRAVETGNKKTTFWGAMQAIALAIIGAAGGGVTWGAKAYFERQGQHADFVETKQAVLEQRVSDLKESDALAHQQIRDEIQSTRAHQDEKLDQLLQAVKKH